jgi:hypothetical protein
MGKPVPQCPIRLGEPCSLCEPGVTGPEDCGLVWLVMTDPELRERLAELRRQRTSHQAEDGLRTPPPRAIR